MNQNQQRAKWDDDDDDLWGKGKNGEIGKNMMMMLTRLGIQALLEKKDSN